MFKKKITDHSAIKPSDDRLEVIGAFNPAVIRTDGYTYMILRVAERAKQTDKDKFLVPVYDAAEGLKIVGVPKSDGYDFSDARVIRKGDEFYLTSISHFRVGKSKDGVNFDFSDGVCIFPKTEYEEYGIEDARITAIDGEFYITYTAVNRNGTYVALMTTKDLVDFERKGVLFSRDDKDCVIFPEKIGGKYYAMHRPATEENEKLDIFIAESEDMTSWTNDGALEGARLEFFDCVRLGAGAVPIGTDEGYLAVYHGADQKDRYVLAAMLLDQNDPRKVLARSKKPLVEPTEDFEKHGFMNDVVFTCGLTEEGDELMIYYGVCDLDVAVASVSLSEIRDNMEAL